MKEAMSSIERTFAALSHKEPDRVPVFLLLTMHGAKLLDIPLDRYLTSSDHIIKAQLKMRELFGHDCYYSLGYAAAESSAFGGEVLFFEDGPPNAGAPVIQKAADIDDLDVPSVDASPALQSVLRTIQGLKNKSKGDVPIIGVVMSPFSLPVMQMGFSSYLDLMFVENDDRFHRLMEINQSFCVEWANRQLEEGATAIGYFDPVSSPTIITREHFLKTGFKVAKGTISRIKGPVVTHFASGRCMNILEDVVQTGTLAVGVSSLEDLSDLKAKSSGKLSLIGNLNGIEMPRWGLAETELHVKTAINKAGIGGGFILSDNHGEIPYQVPWDVLRWIMNAAVKHGTYPLKGEMCP